MKKIFVLASLFIAAAIVSCEKNESPANKVKSDLIEITAIAPAAPTRTSVEADEEGTSGYDYIVKWSEGDEIKLGYGVKGGGNDGHEQKVISVQEDPTIGKFYVSPKPNQGDNAVITALYPLSASLQQASGPCHDNATNHFYIKEIKSEQTCGENTPDPTVSLMFSYFANPNEQGDANVAHSVQFEHIVAYGKLIFKGLPEGDIKSVTLTISDEGARLTGSYFAYNWEKEQIVAKTDEENWFINGSTNANLKDTEIKNSVKVTCPENTTNNVWFAVIPSYEKAYTSGSVAVELADKTLTKEFTGKELKFTAGEVLAITVDMTDAQ